mgnify:CR=1 FL=1
MDAMVGSLQEKKVFQKNRYEMLPGEFSDWMIWLVIHSSSSSECFNKRCMSDLSAAGSCMSLSRSEQQIWRLSVLRYVVSSSAVFSTVQSSLSLSSVRIRNVLNAGKGNFPLTAAVSFNWMRRSNRCSSTAPGFPKPAAFMLSISLLKVATNSGSFRASRGISLVSHILRTLKTRNRTGVTLQMFQRPSSSRLVGIGTWKRMERRCKSSLLVQNVGYVWSIVFMRSGTTA